MTDLAINRALSPDDAMNAGDLDHYFSCGLSALKVLRAAAILTDNTNPNAILDYGAGAGRVTRWLQAAYSNAIIHACDVRSQDMEFLRSTLNVTDAWTVASKPIPREYDIIWVGSVITHLSAKRTEELMGQLLRHCAPTGMLVLSFHGPSCIQRHDNTPFRYIHDQGWRQIKKQYGKYGYGYADYHDMPNYGISVCEPSWMLNLAARLHCRVALLSSRAWDNHHDVIAVQKLSNVL
jgi:SAM-dependent methyltransferase